MRKSIPYTYNQEVIDEAEITLIEDGDQIVEERPKVEDSRELPEWAKDIPELHHVCDYTRPENIAENFKHFLAFNKQMKSWRYNENIKAELIEGMFRRLNETPDQIRKAIFEEMIEWS